MAAQPSFARRSADHLQKFATMRITRKDAVERAARRILALKPRYQAVARATGVPWIMLGCLHMRESSNDFRGVLHNGQHIIGTGRRTSIEPKGRGPFSSWEQAAVDACKIKGWVGRPASYWDLGRILYEMERFNGWGYAYKGRPSPYMWAGSDQYSRGKYVADHVYSSTFVDPQLGVGPVYKRVMELEGVMPEGRLQTPPGQWKAKAKRVIETTGVGTFLSWNTVEAVREFMSSNQLLLLVAAGVALWLLLNYLQGEDKKPDGLDLEPAQPDELDVVADAVEDDYSPTGPRGGTGARRKKDR